MELAVVSLASFGDTSRWGASTSEGEVTWRLAHTPERASSRGLTKFPAYSTPHREELCTLLPREFAGEMEETDAHTLSSGVDHQEETKSGDVLVEDSGMRFQKRIVPKQRTQSVQSVLSSVSLKSFVQQKPFVPPPHSQSQFIHTKTHIQAPAAAASSKRRVSFEIGQRLPFKKDAVSGAGQGESESTSVALTADSHAVDVESDGDVDVAEENKLLTENALKNLGSFSKFQPAVVDLTMRTTPPMESATKQPQVDTAALLSKNSSQVQLNVQPQAQRIVSQARLLREGPPNLSPQRTPELQHVQNAEQLLSQTTSTQDLHSFQPSPTSMQDNTNLKTINDPKRPMYIPAVLRQSNTNLKPEDMKHINEQNSRRSKNVLTDAAQSLRSQTSHWRLAFESPANLPTRAHWRRDVSRNSCAYCDKQFSFFERRHHCRRCGDIFCAQHTSHLLKLGADAQFTIGGSGMLCKVCDNCIKDYEVFVRSKFGDTTLAKKSSVVKLDGRQGPVENGAVAGSVPADWTWSSF